MHLRGRVIQTGAAQRLTRRNAFVGQRHEKRPATRRRKRRHDLRSARAIGVGFDHGGDLAAGEATTQAAVIAVERIKIDRQDQAAACRSGGICQS